MRKIPRSAEPPALVTERQCALTAVRALGTPTRREDLPETYRGFKADLHRMQHGKCCYCEYWTWPEYNDVEHYRPCSRYWWLAWDWDNLFFACSRCNRKHKNDSFELEDEGARLIPWEPPPGRERPLLLDPCVDDPREHLCYVPTVRRHWVPTYRTLRGKHTIELLELDADALVDATTAYYDSTIEPALREIKSDVSRWAPVVQRLTAPSAAFTGLAEDALARAFPSYPAPPPHSI